MIKVCLHNHTFYSRYALNTIEDFQQIFDEKKLDKIAITDHNFLKSAQEFQKYFGENKVIVGEEIETKNGEIIGLFLKKFVPSGLSLERICHLIKAQGGIVYVPHPFLKKRQGGIGIQGLERIKDYIDVVEIYNGWVHRSIKWPGTSEKLNKKAENWAQKNHKLMFCSTDSHFRTNIGTCYTEMEDFSGPEEFLIALKKKVKFIKRKNKLNLLALRTQLKGILNNDILKFIK